MTGFFPWLHIEFGGWGELKRQPGKIVLWMWKRLYHQLCLGMDKLRNWNKTFGIIVGFYGSCGSGKYPLNFFIWKSDRVCEIHLVFFLHKYRLKRLHSDSIIYWWTIIPWTRIGAKTGNCWGRDYYRYPIFYEVLKIYLKVWLPISSTLNHRFC